MRRACDGRKQVATSVVMPRRAQGWRGWGRAASAAVGKEDEHAKPARTWARQMPDGKGRRDRRGAGDAVDTDDCGEVGEREV